MKREIKLGFTDYSALVFIPDPAQTDGSGKTGLVAADLTVSYTRVETDNDVVVTDVTGSLSDLSALTDAHADWGLKEVSSSLAPGLYRLDIADAVFAAGAWTAVVYVMITTSAAAPSPMEFVLVAMDSLSSAWARLMLSAGQIIPGTVDDTVAPTTTQFEAADITEATADHFGGLAGGNGRIILWTTGALAGQVASISDYALVSGRGRFTVPAMTESPANGDTFLII